MLCVGGSGYQYFKTAKFLFFRDMNATGTGILGANFILKYWYHSPDCVSSMEILNFFEPR
jgi:hypothetical protein